MPFINKRAPKHSRIRPFRNHDATTPYTGRSRGQSVSAFRFQRAVHRPEIAASKCATTAKIANAKKCCKKFERRAWKTSDDVMLWVILFFQSMTTVAGTDVEVAGSFQFKTFALMGIQTTAQFLSRTHVGRLWKTWIYAEKKCPETSWNSWKVHCKLPTIPENFDYQLAITYIPICQYIFPLNKSRRNN